MQTEQTDPAYKDERWFALPQKIGTGPLGWGIYAGEQITGSEFRLRVMSEELALQIVNDHNAVQVLGRLVAELRDVGIPCELFCPACGFQHVDAPEPENGWTNPPHRKHLCHHCGNIWEPYPVATYGALSLRAQQEAAPEQH